MIEKVKALFAKWQVKAAVVGGVLVIGSVFGTCSFEPASSSDAPAPAAAVEAEESSDVIGDVTESTAESVTESVTETTTETTTE
jgi:hypothetical protein